MTLDIPANDHGAIYVLELTGTLPDGLADKTDTAMMAIFGAAVVNTDYVDAISPDMLSGMTLPALITQGYDMPIDDATARDLRDITGTAIVVMSAAFGGQAMQLALPDNVSLIAVLREPRAIKVPEPLTSQAAHGTLDPPKTKPRKSDARMSGMIATYALIAMFTLVALMIWVGG